MDMETGLFARCDATLIPKKFSIIPPEIINRIGRCDFEIHVDHQGISRFKNPKTITDRNLWMFEAIAHFAEAEFIFMAGGRRKQGFKFYSIYNESHWRVYAFTSGSKLTVIIHREEPTGCHATHKDWAAFRAPNKLKVNKVLEDIMAEYEKFHMSSARQTDTAKKK